MKKLDINNRNILYYTTGIIILIMMIITAGTFLFLKAKNNEMVRLQTQQSGEAYEKHYVLITDKKNTTFWQSVYQGAKEYGQQHGAYVELMGENLNDDYSVNDLMKIAIAANVDGIIIDADESAMTCIAINQAVDKGIPVVTAFHDCSISKRTSYVGVSNYNIGMEYGNQVRKYAQSYFQKKDMVTGKDRDDKLSVLVLMNLDKMDASENIIYSGMQDAINSDEKYCDKIEMETKSINATGNFSAEESIRDLFMSKEDMPEIVICLDELNTTCVYQAVVDYNKVGEVNILGFYQSDTIVRAIKRRVILSSITVDTRQMGEYCVRTLDEYLNQEFVSDYLSVDTTVIGQNNVYSYMGGKDSEK